LPRKSDFAVHSAAIFLIGSIGVFYQAPLWQLDFRGSQHSIARE
jgi:hypothetical protein